MRCTAFCNCVDLGHIIPIADLKSLTECGDILPHRICEVLCIPSGSTYAQAAQLLLKQRLEGATKL
jgi:hypothetical protein